MENVTKYATVIFLLFTCVVGVMNFIATSKEIRLVTNSEKDLSELGSRLKMLEVRLSAIEERCLGEN